MPVKDFTVSVRGVGKPDYTREVSSGKERAGLALRFNQRLRIFARSLNIGDAEYPLVAVTPLASGDSTHLRDLETNLAMPITIPAGYTFTLLDYGAAVSEDAMVYSYFDSGLVTTAFVVMGSGGAYYVNTIVGFSTTLFDPTAAAAHTLDIKMYNRGGGDLYGGVTVHAIIEKIGSPDWPTTKEVECPYCGYRQTVPIATSTVVCDECGKTYVVYDLSKYRGSV